MAGGGTSAQAAGKGGGRRGEGGGPVPVLVAKVAQKDVPIGIIASLILCTFLYIAVSAVLTGMVPYPDISSEAAVAAAFRQAGENQNYLKVFQREGRKCRRCKTGIQRIRQGNRSSFYCPHCQTK